MAAMRCNQYPLDALDILLVGGDSERLKLLLQPNDPRLDANALRQQGSAERTS